MKYEYDTLILEQHSPEDKFYQGNGRWVKEFTEFVNDMTWDEMTSRFPECVRKAGDERTPYDYYARFKKSADGQLELVECYYDTSD